MLFSLKVSLKFMLRFVNVLERLKFIHEHRMISLAQQFYLGSGHINCIGKNKLSILQ